MYKSSLLLALFGSAVYSANVEFDLVPGDSVVQHGGAYLLKGVVSPAPTALGGVDAWVLNGQTQNVNDMQFGLQVRAFASSTCGAVESFTATFEQYKIVAQADLVFTVSAGDKYFSVIADWDGGVFLGDSTFGTGGIFTYPDCDGIQTLPSLGPNEDDANTLFDGVTWSSAYLDNWAVLRERVCGGNQFGCPLQTGNRIGTTSPYTISINNDVANDQLTFGFTTAAGYNFQCTFGDSFEPNTDIQINLTPDWDLENWGVTKVTFAVTCDDDFEVFEDCEKLDKKCRVSGDPHFRTWDDHRHHFQGGGTDGAYYDYVTECLDGNGDPQDNLPFNIAARQQTCNGVYTCVEDVLVELDDGNRINFPGNGIPTNVDTGADARGTYSFSNANGPVNYDVGYDSFSISFQTEYNQTAQLTFVYVGRTFQARTSNCLLDKLCGVCGYFSGDPTDDFTRCDDGIVIDNTGTERMRGQSAQSWANTQEFGDSCCREDLEQEFGNSPQCPVTDPDDVPQPDEDCLIDANELCDEAWDAYCTKCQQTNAVEYEEFIEDCEVDACAAAGDDLSGCDFTCAENAGYLDTSSNKCNVECDDEVFDGTSEPTEEPTAEPAPVP